MTKEQRKWLANFCGNEVKFNEPMAKHTSLRVGGPADAYVTPESMEDLSEIVRGCREQNIRYMVIGGGTNLLFKDKGIQGVVIALTKYLKNIHLTYTKKDETVIQAMAGVRMKKLCAFAIRQGLEGMNRMLGIPGTVGGGVMMNAGTAIGSMENLIKTITILTPTGQILRADKKQLNFSYRKLDLTEALASTLRSDAANHAEHQSVILEAELVLHPCDPILLKKEAKEILKARMEKQPIHAPSAGCFFKNPFPDKSAGELIDRCGLKGKSIGDAQVSTKHANFIINRGKASAADIVSLAEMIQETIAKKFNILLEPEVKIVA